MIYYLLIGSFFLASAAAAIKAIRYTVDYCRFRQSFYLVGVPANLALAAALALIIVESGDTPLWDAAGMITLVQLLIAVWAVLSFIFEILYARTYLVVNGRHPPPR